MAEVNVYFGNIADCALIKENFGGRKCVIVTDDNVFLLYKDMLGKVFSGTFESFSACVINHGEDNKNEECLHEIIDFFAERNLCRNDLVIAMGGGVVTDVAGLAAGLYLRGVNIVCVPTSLLGMCDAAIGGKTAINTKYGKNSIGIVREPELTVIDTDFLKTLPAQEYENGMAEVIKTAVIDGGKLWELVSSGSGNISEIVKLCVLCKKRIVEDDENDLGLRHVLNLGHTLGHAIETYYKHNISHGRAVAMGLSAIASKTPHLAEIDNVLKRYGLPTAADIENPENLRDIISLDKKFVDDDNIEAAVIHGIGDVRVEKMSKGELWTLLF